MKHLGLLFSFILLAVSSPAQTQLGSDIDGEAAYDNSGLSVSMSSDGQTVAIGAPLNRGNGIASGHVRVFRYINNVWTQLGDDIDGKESENSGRSVSISSDGSIVAIGSPENYVNGIYTGTVRVYKYNSGAWTQLGNDIIADTAEGGFGWSVSLSGDGNIIAIGAPFYGNGMSAGYVRVYKFISGSWVQLGSSIDGKVAGDCCGFSVSLSGDSNVVAIGSHFNDGIGNDAGHVRVFNYSNGKWAQLGDDIDGEAANDQNGYDVSISKNGRIVAIGAPGNSENGYYSGHVRVYRYDSGKWTQLGSDIDGEAAWDNSGFSISLSGDGSLLAIGAPVNKGNGTNSGQVRVFKFKTGKWLQLGSDIDGEAVNDQCGRSVSISGDGSIVATGASKNGGNGFESGHVRVYKLNDLTWVYPVTYESYIRLYPNPANNQCIIETNPEAIGLTYSIMDILGVEQMSGIINSETTSLNIEELPCGIYYIRISTLNGIPIKIIKL